MTVEGSGGVTVTLDETIVTLSTDSLSLIIVVNNHHGLAQFYFVVALLLVCCNISYLTNLLC